MIVEFIHIEAYTEVGQYINMCSTLHTQQWSVSIGTLFPDLFPGALGISCAGNAMKNGIFKLETYDLREFAVDKHKTVDDSPFGGGAGMVIKPEIIDRFFCLEQNIHKRKIYMSPRGKVFNQTLAHQLITSDICILCGRYEGVDQRVLDHWNVEEISIGDFVTFGGEIPAIAMLEACIRLLPNVIQHDSILDESFEKNLLEYNQYTRPMSWYSENNQNIVYNVPSVLLSGNHKEIYQWRLSNSIAITKERRQDLWNKYIYHEEYDDVTY